MPTIPNTSLDVFPLCLGGNVFGWNVNEQGSFAVLDAYAAAGGNFVDTADVYSSWAEGNRGGESETIIGRWLASRGNRDEIVVATKVAKLEGRRGLSATNIRAAAEGSLRRLGTDRIDLYYAHEDDLAVSLEETLGALDELVREGKVLYIGASNFDAERLDESLEVSQASDLTSYVVLQPHYNLMAREFERELRGVCEKHELGCLPYFSLAKGFLTGKYRADGAAVRSDRAEGAMRYLDDRGSRVLAALDELAAAQATTVAAVALAWLAAQPTVVAPIASARTPAQLTDLLPMATLRLSADELERVALASA